MFWVSAVRLEHCCCLRIKAGPSVIPQSCKHTSTLLAASTQLQRDSWWAFGLHICRVLAKLPLALKAELCIKYSAVHMGGKAWACMTSARFFQAQKTVLGPNHLISSIRALHVSHVNTGRREKKKQSSDAKEQTLSCGRLILLHFSSRMSLFDTLVVHVCLCVCVALFSLWIAGESGSTKRVIVLVWAPPTVCRRGCRCGRCTQTGKVRGKRSLIHHVDPVNNGALIQQAAATEGVCFVQTRQGWQTASKTARLLRPFFFFNFQDIWTKRVEVRSCTESVSVCRIIGGVIWKSDWHLMALVGITSGWHVKLYWLGLLVSLLSINKLTRK